MTLPIRYEYVIGMPRGGLLFTLHTIMHDGPRIESNLFFGLQIDMFRLMGSAHGKLRDGMDRKEKKSKSDAQPEGKAATEEKREVQQEGTGTAEKQEAQAPTELEQKELEIVQLKEQLAATQAETASLKDQMLRDRADLENYRKRLIRDKEDSIRFANENLIKDLLQPLDDFNRALEAAESTKEYDKVHDGVVMVNSQIFSTLEKNWGLTKIEAVGKEFNPEEHEAYMVVEDASLETETVLDEFITGYKLHGRVLRPAKVKVGKPNV